MTLPAAVADWIGDRRQYRTVQHDDWLQVIGDYRESLKWTGPKLKKFVKPATVAVESLLQSLMAPQSDSINPAPRDDLRRHLSTLEVGAVPLSYDVSCGGFDAVGLGWIGGWC
jgi:hypothetical protein